MLEADAYAYPVKGAPEARKRKRLKPVPDALREAAVRLHHDVIMTSLSPAYRLIASQ